MTIQKYYDENGKDLFKLIVYSLKNAFICDINIEFNEVKSLYLMDDGNVIIDLNQIIIEREFFSIQELLLMVIKL